MAAAGNQHSSLSEKPFPTSISSLVFSVCFLMTSGYCLSARPRLSCCGVQSNVGFVFCNTKHVKSFRNCRAFVFAFGQISIKNVSARRKNYDFVQQRSSVTQLHVMVSFNTLGPTLRLICCFLDTCPRLSSSQKLTAQLQALNT